MPTNSVRPSIAETAYRFFDRAVHPEMFSPAIVGRIRSSQYGLVLGICEGGHYLQFTCNGQSMTEVTGPESEVLSSYGLQQTYFFNEAEELVLEAEKNFKYNFAGQTEILDFSVFTRIQMELEYEASKAFISHQFPAKNRLQPGPLSLAQIDGGENSISVSIFHTFPDDLVVLRTQSLFEFPTVKPEK